MTSALTYFLNEERIIADRDAPDEAIDLAFQLSEKDWQTLSEKWESHSDEWKAEVTLYAGLVSLELSAPIIIRAMNSSNPTVVLQALLSAYESIIVERYSDEFIGQLSYTFSESDRNKILNEIASRISTSDHQTELEELKAVIEKL